MTPKQQREQFIRGLSPMNQYNLRMMAKFHDTQDNITEALAEAEKFTLSQQSASSSFPIFPAANPYVETNKSGMTKTEIESLIKNTIASSEPQQPQQVASSQFQPHPAGPYKNLRDENIGRFISWITGETPEFTPVPNPELPPKPKKKVEIDSDEELAGLTKRQLSLHVAKAVKKAVKTQQRCSNCNRTGHNSRKCTRKKKKKNKSKKAKVNLATIDAGSDSDSDSNTSNDSSDDSSDSDTGSSVSSDSEGDITVNIAKSKKK